MLAVCAVHALWVAEWGYACLAGGFLLTGGALLLITLVRC
jgi:hypothetical protein